MLGIYRIERLLGRGGMGAVFLAYDTTLHRQVAVKVLQAADSETSRSQLLREARNAAALNHPNICTVHEVGEANGASFIAMEHVEGCSLRERLDVGVMPVPDAVRYALQAADALAYAHEHNVVHRDFKAANVIVTSGGRLKIVDFGLARRSDAWVMGATTTASMAGAVAGTPYAMAPEQVRGDSTDARTDIWALGILLYEMVGGGQPFEAQTTAELFSSILRDAPRPLPPGVPVEIRAVIDRCLEKVPDRRYQDAGEVRAALEIMQAGAAPAWIGLRYHLRRRPWLASTTALVGVAVFVLALDVRGARSRLMGIRPESPIKLAVLPFENLTGDPEQEYFSDGLTEELITQLGGLRSERLSVIARTSSMRYKNSDATIEQIGHDLHVDYVMEGSARREGNRVRISAKLIQMSDQTQRWSDSFERELSGILAVQNDVARGVVESLALTLLPEEQRRLASARPVNPEAYEAYLKGLNLEANPSPPNLTNALKYFELALDKDPNYAAAYAGIAGVWVARRQTANATRSEAEPKLKAAIQRALQLDDTLADAHFRLAEQYAWTDWNWPGADREFRRAIELNPNQALTRSTYADFLVIMRRPDEAIAQIKRALELDPVSSQTQAFYGRVLMFVRRYDESIAQYRATLKTTPDQQIALANIRVVLHVSGRYNEAFAADQAWAVSNKNRGGPELAEALDRGYKEGGYRGAMRRTAEALAVRGTDPFLVAQFFVRAEENDLALDWMQKGYQANETMPYLNVAPVWDPLRGNPRFEALVRQMNLPG